MSEEALAALKISVKILVAQPRPVGMILVK